MVNGIVFRIERFAIHDGPGIRTTVFLKGCPLRCAWCHSPESQSPRPEFMPLQDRCIACGACVAGCPQQAIAAPGAPTRLDLCRLCRTCVDLCPTGARTMAGDEMPIESVVAAIERDRIFYDESGGGVTVSGGEPLMQPAFTEAIVEQCRWRRIHVAVDTSGFGDPDALERIRPDLFLFDVKAIDEERHRAITGVSNRVILENLARLAARAARPEPVDVGLRTSDFGHRTSDSELRTPDSGLRGSTGSPRPERVDTCVEGRTPDDPCRIIVRFPLVPGLTDDDANVHDIGRLVSSLGIGRIDVLPYHRAGMAKYERLGRPYALASTEPPSPERVAHVVKVLTEHRLTVGVGGT